MTGQFDSDRAGSVDSATCKSLSRRVFLASTAGTGALLAGCTSGGGDDGGSDGGGDGGSTEGTPQGSKPFSGQTLKVSVWSGPYVERFRKHVADPFEKETGATVELVPGWSEIISKIKAAPEDSPPYDVTISDGYFYSQGRAEDLFMPVRYENVPNIDEVWEYLREFRPKKYGVPVDGQPLSISYSNDLENPPSTWWDLEPDQKLAMDGGFYIYSAQIGAFLADEMEGTKELYDESTHDAPFDALDNLNVDIWYSSGSDIWQYLRQGSADVATYYGIATALNVKEEQNLDISVSVPDKTGGYMDHWSVVRGTDNRDLGEALLNFMLRADIQTGWNKDNKAVMSNKNTEHTEQVDKHIPNTAAEIEKFRLPDWDYLSQYPEFYDKFKKLKSN
jgi:spermidine/putrescine transport system substrate-binding protein